MNEHFVWNFSNEYIARCHPIALVFALKVKETYGKEQKGTTRARRTGRPESKLKNVKLHFLWSKCHKLFNTMRWYWAIRVRIPFLTPPPYWFFSHENVIISQDKSIQTFQCGSSKRRGRREQKQCHLYTHTYVMRCCMYQCMFDANALWHTS